MKKSYTPKGKGKGPQPMLTGQMMHKGHVVTHPGLPLKKKPKGR